MSMLKVYKDVYVSKRDYLVWHKHDNLFVHMLLRNNNEGPLYWCSVCGFSVGEGMAMALRLYEANYYGKKEQGKR